VVRDKKAVDELPPAGLVGQMEGHYKVVRAKTDLR